jgi:hypothetical protein
MTTTTMHSNVQRSRFFQHATAALASAMPAVFHLFKPAPDTASAEGAAREAAKVRELASTYLKTEPSFAADLYAAASRHESQYAD